MINRDELYHHGVQGMKWGKRNGPPYPLNAAGKASLAKQKKADNASGGSGDTEYGSLLKKSKKNETLITDYSKIPKEKVSERKEKVIRSGDIREAYSNRNYYSDDELRKVKARYTLNLEVKQLTEADKKKGMETVEKIAQNMETINKLGNAISKMSINIANVYTSASRIATAKKIINGEPVAKSQQKQGDKQNKKKDNTKYGSQEENMSLLQKIQKKASEKATSKFEAKEEAHYKKIAEKEGIQIDPNDPRRDTYTKAAITKRNGWNKENTFTPERQKSMLNTAKTQDKYDLTFLEMVQNTSFENMSKKEFKKKYGRDPKTIRLEAYKEYLKNPEDFIDNRLVKWNNW